MFTTDCSFGRQVRAVCFVVVGLVVIQVVVCISADTWASKIVF